jgi:hypothetical protein
MKSLVDEGDDAVHASEKNGQNDDCPIPPPERIDVTLVPILHRRDEQRCHINERQKQPLSYYHPPEQRPLENFVHSSKMSNRDQRNAKLIDAASQTTRIFRIKIMENALSEAMPRCSHLRSPS